MDIEDNEYDFDEYLKIYWQYLFPFKPIYEWLRYGEKVDYIERREIAYFYKVEDEDRGEGAKRHLCYKKPEEFEADIIKASPLRIEIGPVYNYSPRDHEKFGAKYQAQERELIFDIDMDDYDSVRFCCQGKNVCEKCWHFMAIAIQVIQKAMVESFNYKSILFAFSGRRGLHAWIGDKNARLLTNEARGAIVGYLSVIEGEKTDLPLHLHPFLEEVYHNILEKSFEKYIIPEQELLSSPEGQKRVLSFIPNEDDRQAIEKSWQNQPNDIKKWKILEATVNDRMAKKAKGYQKTNPIQNIVFSFTYPRFDANVSKQLNHLLKSPFCVHPSTGRVCVPVDPDTCFDFNPNDVITLKSLINELKSLDLKQEREDIAYETSLGIHLDLFKNKFLLPLVNEVKKEQMKKGLLGVVVENNGNTNVLQDKNNLSW